MSYLDDVHRIETGTAELYVEQVGPADAPVVLYLHGGPGYNSASFRDLVGDDLTDLQMLYADQRGSGRSYADGPFGLADLADDVAAIAAALGLNDLTLLGHGFGAMIAVAAASAYPDVVRRLILASPWLSMPILARDLNDASKNLSSGGALRATARADDEGKADAAGTRSPSEAAALVDEAFALVNPKVLFDAMEFPRKSALLRLEHADATVLPGPAEVVEPLEVWTLDVLDAAESLTQPTVLIVGTKDATCYPNQVEPILTRMPGALVSLLDAGHYPWLDEPDAFLDVLTQALALPSGPADS